MVWLLYNVVLLFGVIFVFFMIVFNLLLVILLNIRDVILIFNFWVEIFKWIFKICLMFICDGIFNGFNMMLIYVLFVKYGIFFFGKILEIIFLLLWCLVILLFLVILCFLVI